MKLLGINTSHNPSICQLTDGKINFHLDETRVRRDKYFMPRENDCFYQSIDKLKDKDFDGVVVASYDRRFESVHNETSPEEDKIILKSLQEQLPNCPFYFQKEHHLYHALAAHTYSKNKESLVIVMDGGGAQLFPTYQEMESIYLMNQSVLKLYSRHSNIRTQKVLDDSHVQDMFFKIDETDYEFNSESSSGKLFNDMAASFRMPIYSEGKVMGMSAYGHHNQGYVEEEELLSQADKSLRLQNKTFNDTIELIKHATTYSDCKNIVLSGGYALNCVNNYRYLDEFPKHNFFIDPNPGDSGTSTGAAIWLYFYLKAGGF
jgi:carbamoyltransferase